MEIVLWVVHIIVAIVLVSMVMLQQGKGADVGAAFGSGASNTVFGARGSANFLSRTTAVLAVIFFVTSLSLAYFVTGKTKNESVIDREQSGQQNNMDTQTKAANEQELVNQLSQQLQKSSDVPVPEITPAAAPVLVSPVPEVPKP